MDKNITLCVDIIALNTFLDHTPHSIINKIAIDKTLNDEKCLALEKDLIIDLIKIIKADATPLLTTELNNISDILFYLTRFYNKEFRRYRSNNDYILFVLNVVGISISNFSKDSYKYLQYIYETVENFKTFKTNANRYIQTEDLRGLLYWLCDEINIEFDNITKDIEYQYIPPKITNEWSQKNRKEFEPIEFWFDETQLGKSLFIVLYTKRCRYSFCAGCDLPSKSYTPNKTNKNEITTEQSNIYMQMDHIMYRSLSRVEKNTIKEITLSNNGNLFDTDTMPYLSLLYAVDSSINNLPNLKKIVIESRLEVIEIEKLKVLKETIDRHNKNITLEIAVGLEIMNDELRNKYYRKGLSRKEINEFLEILNSMSLEIKKKKAKDKKCEYVNKAFCEGEEKYSFSRDIVSTNGALSVKFYMMYMCIPDMFEIRDENNKRQIKKLTDYVKESNQNIPSQIARQFAIEDIQAASDFLSSCLNNEKAKNISITIHINPTYMTEKLKYKSFRKNTSSKNSIEYPKTKEELIVAEKSLKQEQPKSNWRINYRTPVAEDIIALIRELKPSKKINYFISSNDEGLSMEDINISYAKELQLREEIKQFNRRKFN